jgi:hypothetical protein
MSEDLKRAADIMRATSQVLEIMAPFSVEDRIKIFSGAVVFSGVATVIIDESPEVTELMKKVKPKASG